MKFTTTVLSVLVASAMLSACGETEQEKDARHQRELECLQVTGDRYCRSPQEVAGTTSQPVLVEQPMQNAGYAPVQPGTYTNYYGDPRYGNWDASGQYRFNDPYGQQASSTNAFLIGAGLGGLATYALTKSDFFKKNPSGWVPTTDTVSDYYSSSGKKVSSTDYAKIQRQRDALNQQNKRIAEQNAKIKQLQQQRNDALKKQQAAVNQAKASTPFTQADADKKKAEIKARLAASQQQKPSNFNTYTQKEKQVSLKQKLKASLFTRSSSAKSSSGFKSFSIKKR